MLRHDVPVDKAIGSFLIDTVRLDHFPGRGDDQACRVNDSFGYEVTDRQFDQELVSELTDDARCLRIIDFLDDHASHPAFF